MYCWTLHGKGTTVISRNNEFACVCFTLMDSFVSPNISPVQSVTQCLSGWVEFNGPISAKISRDGPLSGEGRSRTKSRSSSVFTQERTGPLLSDAAATVHLLTTPNGLAKIRPNGILHFNRLSSIHLIVHY